MLTKEVLKKHIESFPEEFSIDQLVERLIIIEKINNANKQSEGGEVISETDLNKAVEQWFK
ncbi:hypothetical protein C7S20_06755 [Christiangramia fulva]|uniref:Uncharacterized protein n=1 Tax=Christiangramia fulva TaxID=2126553 RepID=A0A2R3Z403_9FLAO|nr:hypothetical protein [Christiangramia fulva]AVR44995.1 hypothetical protein C7S20_06755 [Christiangramia fulva]